MSYEEPHKMGQARCLAESAEAFQIELSDPEVIALTGDRVHWIPKSQIHDDSEVYEVFGQGELVVREWFAEQRGWL